VSEATLADIARACRLAPDRADFHFHAGSIFAMARQADPALQDEAVMHLQRAYELGYPRTSQKSVPPELVRLLPAELQTPDTGPIVSPPAPLYASPSESPDLGRFARG
jgi:hypothetical protein